MKVRREPRIAFETVVIVRCAAWRDPLALKTVNVSRGGAFLRADQPPPVGTPTTIRLRRLAGWIEIPGVVAHVALDGSVGFGVRFNAAGDTEIDAIDQLLDSARGSGPIHLPSSAGDDAAAMIESARSPLRELQPHEVLGVAFDASPQEITAAFRRLKARFHPDTVANVKSPRIRAAVAACSAEVQRAYDELAQRVDRANEADPRDGSAARLGMALLEAGHFSDARTPLAAGLEDDPNNVRLRAAYLFAEGEHLRSQQRIEEACEYLKAAVSLEPSHAAAVEALRQCYAQRRNSAPLRDL